MKAKKGGRRCDTLKVKKKPHCKLHWLKKLNFCNSLAILSDKAYSNPPRR